MTIRLLFPLLLAIVLTGADDDFLQWGAQPGKGEDGQPLFSLADKEAELSVRIHGKLGKVRWPVPDYVRGKPLGKP